MQYAKIIIDRRIHGKIPDGHPCHMLLPVKYDTDGVKVEIVQCSVLSEGAGCSLIRISDSQGMNSKDITTGPSESMFGECSVMRISKNRYLATVMNNNCRLAQLLAASGCFLTNAVPRTDDVIEWNIFAPNNMFISNFVDRLREEGYGVQRLSTQNLAVENTLTDKQDEIIRYAYENGYYDVPKTIDTDSLCTRFNCSKSTLSVLLRGAEKKLIGVYLTTNRDRDKK